MPIPLTHLEAGAEFPATTPGKIRLYDMRFCAFAHKARLIMGYKGIDYERVLVNIKRKPDWFLKRNPKGETPTLELDGKVLTESAVICQYLDDAFPKNKLTPSDPFEKALDRAVLERINKFVPVFYNIFRQEGGAEKARNDLTQEFKYFDGELKQRGGKYFGGDKPCLLDFYLWPHIERVSGLLVPKEPAAAITKASYPQLAAWVDVMLSLQVVKDNKFDDQSHARFFKSYFSPNPDYDFPLQKK